MWDTNFPTPQQMHGFEHAVSSVTSALPRIIATVLLIAVGLLLFRLLAAACMGLFGMRHSLAQKPVFLELTPHVLADKSLSSTEELYIVIHGLEKARSRLDKLLHRKTILSLEMPSTNEDGIRFVVRTTEKQRQDFERDIGAHLHDTQFREVTDYMPDGSKLREAKVLVFKQTRSFVYPLRVRQSLEEHDQGTYLMGAMTKLLPGETIALQITASPVRIRGVDKIAARVLQNDMRLHDIGKRHVAAQPLLAGITAVLFGITGLVTELFHGPSLYQHHTHEKELDYQRQVAQGRRTARSLSSIELKKLAEPIYDKLSQPHFRVSLRVLIACHDAEARAVSIRKAIGSFDDPPYQALEARPNFPYMLRGPYRRFLFKHRLPALLDRNSCILSAAELSALYHLPNSESAKTEGVATALSRTLAVPTAVKRLGETGGFDVILGRNNHLGASTAIGMTAAERAHHLYIIGATGTGKTTMLQYAIIQDIRNGKGIAVVDPHGDMAEWILQYIPKDRLDDVIYLDPRDVAYPPGLNVLEVPTGLEGDELRVAQDFVVDAIVSLFRKVFSEDDSGGHRIENTLRFAVHTAFTVPDATLFTVRKLLINPDYRKPIVAALKDETLKEFWVHEFGMAGNYQKYKKIDGVTTKIGRFEEQLTAKRILEQPKSTIDFDEILNGKILICNLAKGRIGVDTSELFGTTVLAKLQLAAYRRIDIPEDERKPFYLYVDEFQNFATPLFTQILSESRKYKLFITMAEQSTSQQDRDVVENILGNAGTVVCFRTANPADEALMLHQFSGIEPGEIPNLSAFNFYMRIAAQEAQRPFSGKTVKLEGEGSKAIAKQAKAASRRNYAIVYQQPKPESVQKPTQTAQQASHETLVSILAKRNKMKKRKKNRGSGKK